MPSVDSSLIRKSFCTEVPAPHFFRGSSGVTRNFADPRAPDGAFWRAFFRLDRALLTAPAFLTLATFAHSLHVTDVP